MTTLDVMKEDQRRGPGFGAPELDMLLGYLSYERDTLLWKLDGLNDEQLRRPHVPSGLTLLGLVKHLTDVERGWVRGVVGGEDIRHYWDANDPQRYWRIEPDDTTAGIIAGYRAEGDRSDAIVRAQGLDAPVSFVREEAERDMNVRWVVIHLIEETARHVGHADLIREAIDGATGE
jgi:uncharacterized damage-inducible protein DinB